MGLICLIFIPKLKGQISTFEYLLATPMDENISDIYEDSDGFIYFTARQYNVGSTDAHQGLIVRMDFQGKIVDTNVFFFPGKNVFPTCILPSENQQYDIVGWFYGPSYDESGLVFYKMNLNCDLVKSLTYHFPYDVKITNVWTGREPNGDISVFGAFETNLGQKVPYVYVLNSNFDSIKAKHFFDFNDTGHLSNFKRLQDGNYWSIKEGKGQYEMLDSELNITFIKRIPSYLSGPYGVKWDSDTSFYMIARQLYPEPSHTLSFIKQFHPMDTTGYLFNQWRISDTIDIPATNKGIDYINKDTIFMGGSTDFWIGIYNTWPSWFVILQTDSLLNIRWERFYGGDAFYTMRKIIATKDGGCLVAGVKYDYNNTSTQQQDIVILKLNEQGLLTGTGEKPPVKITEAIVYPNPGSGYISVRIAIQYRQSVFELFDLEGKCVLNKTLTSNLERFCISFLEPGTYVYRISAKDGLYETGKLLKQ